MRYEGFEVPMSLDVYELDPSTKNRAPLCSRMIEMSETNKARGCWNIDSCQYCILGKRARDEGAFSRFVKLSEKELMALSL